MLGGQIAGDVASMVLGGLGSAIGAEATGATIAAVPASAGASLGLSAGAAAFTAQSATMTLQAASNLEKDIAVLRQSDSPGSPGNAQGPKTEQHHLLPKQFKDCFESKGLNIEAYTVKISKSEHRLKPEGLHVGGALEQAMG
jgi:hypothetical protein